MNEWHTVDAADEDARMQAARTLTAALARLLDADEVVETHISWVLLAGRDAWKIKKPLRLPFLDYSTAAKRRHWCEEELRVNRRLAPGLYLGVQAISGTAETPILDDTNMPPIEYAVHMRRFGEPDLFSSRVDTAQLDASDVDALGDLLADFHAHAAAASVADGYATPAWRADAAQAALAGAAQASAASETQALAAWLHAEAGRLNDAWNDRLRHGRVRECHGDLHLANIIRTANGVQAFDAIEFDERLRWTDVADDIAFPVMDLGARGRPDLGVRLLNRWLDATGDRGAVQVFRFAVVYRALVRAQVTLMRHADGAARKYWRHALAWTRPQERQLTIMHGLPGSGKTFQSQRLLEREGAIRLRSDVERKRLFGLAPQADSRAAGFDIYTPGAGERTYAHLMEEAARALQAGYPVILDAAFLRRRERDQARQLAARLGARFTIVPCEATPDVLGQRLHTRTADASEADARVLDLARARLEPLSPDERACAAQ